MADTPAPCTGKMLGHDFPFTGARCMRCGVPQKSLNPKPVRRLKPAVISAQRERIRGIHSRMHALAKDISEWCHEPKQFAMYLGRIKAMGVERAYTVWSQLKQSRTRIRNRAALFMTLSKEQPPELKKN